MSRKERVVVYLDRSSVEALDLLRAWLSLRSRGAVVEALSRRFLREFSGQILAWASEAAALADEEGDM